MAFEDHSVLEEYVALQATNPMPSRTRHGRTVYLSHNLFGPMRSFKVVPKITDFGLARRGDFSPMMRQPIQPPLYHAPEVILGTGWSYSADIWNLGVLVRVSSSSPIALTDNFWTNVEYVRRQRLISAPRLQP